MYRHLLFAATLGAGALLAVPASAHGHAPVHPNVVSAFDFRIIVHDGPNFGHHRHAPRGYLKPQPWPPRFKHYAPAPRWHHRPHHKARHFWFGDHHRRPDFKRAHHKGWVHAPIRHHGRDHGFKHHRRDHRFKHPGRDHGFKHRRHRR